MRIRSFHPGMIGGNEKMTDDAIAPTTAETPVLQQFSCRQCGAKLVFQPGTQTQKCEYCGFENPIPQSEADIVEEDFCAQLLALSEKEPTTESLLVKCEACGVDVTLPPNITTDLCPFCGSTIVASGISKKTIRPKALLPFRITKGEAVAAFQRWLSNLWFAPEALKHFAQLEKGMQGIYLPYWTYDSDATSFYRGERGVDYWTTETYTVREGGRIVTKTRQVKRTRWYPASGTVWNHFDDILIPATDHLPPSFLDALEPWDLDQLTPYDERFLAGFRVASYSVTLPEGFSRAKEIMGETIRETVRRDIGGDHQRIHAIKTQYDRITFKHILLPVWLNTYRFRDKSYRFLVNARTGEVQGERPYSWIKIALAILGAIAILAGLLSILTHT